MGSLKGFPKNEPREVVQQVNSFKYSQEQIPVRSEKFLFPTTTITQKRKRSPSNEWGKHLSSVNDADFSANRCTVSRAVWISMSHYRSFPDSSAACIKSVRRFCRRSYVQYSMKRSQPGTVRCSHESSACFPQSGSHPPSRRWAIPLGHARPLAPARDRRR